MNIFELKNLKTFILSAIALICIMLAISFFMMFLMVQGRRAKQDGEEKLFDEKNIAMQVQAGEKDEDPAFGFTIVTPDRTRDNVVDASVDEKINECNDEQLYCEYLVQNKVMGRQQIISAPMAVYLFKHDYETAKENGSNVKVTFEKDGKYIYSTDNESIDTINDIKDIDDGAYLIYKNGGDDNTKYRYVYTKYYDIKVSRN